MLVTSSLLTLREASRRVLQTGKLAVAHAEFKLVNFIGSELIFVTHQTDKS